MADEVTNYALIISTLFICVVLIAFAISYGGSLSSAVNAFGNIVSGFFKTIVDAISGAGAGLIKFLLFTH